ncbi:MAG: oxygen-independent coproporphyrinogen III oxidase [Pseudomonadota bacterium]|nr:oxygen-independent coproporphyrinogen III oxidase [Pseudomonadota bacterium]QKK05631.1 MAG: oxygen-independent coproporphyrinogen III oxidase [Pseudomonadota bacterium]
MMMQQIPYDLLTKYDRPAPRYTSFPTAVQFDQDIAQDDCAALLSGIDTDKPVSLYIHVPFCHQLCHYCGCNTKIVNSYSPVQSYLELLHAEIRKAGEYLPKDLKINRLHFGGGSPNFLKTDDVAHLLETLTRFARLDSGAVIDMEMDPRLLTKEKIRAYAQMGVKRASLGIQDFDPQVQNCINRIQPFEQVKSCVETLRDEGIYHLNFDLIIGLPEQTAETVAKTSAQAIALNPDRFSVFGYAHVPWMKKHQKLLEVYHLPDARRRFEMTALLNKTLQDAGYAAIGMDHFARKDDPLYTALENKTLRRNFQGYTDDESEIVLGFGLSSISSFGGAYLQNITDAPAYRRAVNNGLFPVKRGRVLTEEDTRRRALIEEIMCYFTVDLGHYTDIPHLREETESALALLEQDGILERDGGRLTVTEGGRPFVRIVAACFDPYFQPCETRHAKAV